jgi:hypothetical protein
LPAFSEDLTDFQNLSGLGGSESEWKDIREFAEWVGIYSVNSTILEILIRTKSYPLTTTSISLPP